MAGDEVTWGAGDDGGRTGADGAGDGDVEGQLEAEQPDYIEDGLVTEADYRKLADRLPGPRRITPFTIILVIVFVVSAATLLGVTSLGVFRDYFQNEAVLWVLRLGLILMIASVVAFLALQERSNVRYYERILDKLVESNSRLRLLLGAGRDLGSTLDLHEQLEIVLNYALAETRAELGAVYLWNKNQDVLELEMVKGVDERKMMFGQLPMEKGLLGDVASRREMVVIEDSSSLDRRDNVFFGAEEPGSHVLIPLVPRNKLVGIMVMGAAGPHSYTNDEKMLLKGFAELAGLAITNAELYRIARKSLDVLARHRGVTGSVLDQMVAGVITANSSGRVDVFNREAQRLTGYSFAEMTQKSLRPETSLDDNPLGPLEQQMLEVLKNPSAAKEGEALIMKKDRTVLPVSYRVYPLGGDSNVAGAAAVFMEAHEKAGEREKRAGVDYQLLLRSLGARIERLYTHPLSRVLEKVRRMELEQWAQSREDVVEILEAGSAALLGLIEDVEHFMSCVTVREWDSPGEYQPGELVQSVVGELLKTPQYEGLVVQVRMAGLPRVFGYERMMRSGLEELIENAAIAARESGGRVEVTGERSDGFVRVLVKDTGPGVPPEVRDYMYLPFFTTREGCSGLGLATVKKVMQRLGGRVGCMETDGGAVFFLDFPTSPIPEAEQGGLQ